MKNLIYLSIVAVIAEEERKMLMEELETPKSQIYDTHVNKRDKFKSKKKPNG